MNVGVLILLPGMRPGFPCLFKSTKFNRNARFSSCQEFGLLLRLPPKDPPVRFSCFACSRARFRIASPNASNPRHQKILLLPCRSHLANHSTTTSFQNSVLLPSGHVSSCPVPAINRPAPCISSTPMEREPGHEPQVDVGQGACHRTAAFLACTLGLGKSPGSPR